MLKFFRRSKSDKSDRTDSDKRAGNSKKNAVAKGNVKELKLSATLENSLLSRGGSSGASASTSNHDKNKVQFRGRPDDDRQPPQPDLGDLQQKRGGIVVDRKASHLQKSAIPSLVVVDDDLRRENAKSKSYAKENSSRNEIVDLTRGDRTSLCRNQNDRSRSRPDEKIANAPDNKQLHLLQSQNQCQPQYQQQQQQQHNHKQQQQQQHNHHESKQPNSSLKNSSDQAPSTTSFNPLNKSREFFYEIMGKNRNRNRNRQRTKDNKPYNRDNISTVASCIVREETVEPVVDQQTTANELDTQQPEQLAEQPLECVDTTTNQTQGYPYSDGDDLCANVNSNISNEQNIDKLVTEENTNKNDENIENFGYQITKSKNRSNIVMNYEGEDQDDREADIEKNTSNGNCCAADSTEDRDDPMGDAGQPSDVSESQRADASYDAIANSPVENRFSSSDAKEESDKETSNNISATNWSNETTTHREADLNAAEAEQHVYQIENLNECDVPQHFDYSEDEQSRQADIASAALESASPENDAVPEVERHSLRNFEDDRNSTDGHQSIDRDDLDEQETSIPLSIQLIGGDRDTDNKQLRQELDDTNMGQDNSKSASDRHSRSRSDHVNSSIVIPTITVADYSEASAKQASKDNVTVFDSASFANDEVFYDTSEGFDFESVVLDNVKDTIQFVACDNSDDRVIIEDDPNYDDGAFDNLADIPTTVIESTDLHSVDNSNSNLYRSDTDDNVNLSNTSSSSTISDIKDSPDSGIELLDDSRNNPLSGASDNLLHINRDSDSFIRGGSTDCDESFLLPSDSEDHDIVQRRPQPYRQSNFDSEIKDKPIFIDSISLPDVVVESTGGTGSGGFSGMGSSNSTAKTVDHIEDHHHHPTKHQHGATIVVTDHNDNETRDLVNHEARYSAQLEEAQKIILSTQTKVNDLQAKIDSLEKELSIKSWNVDRLQGELQATNKEDACVRRRLNLLQTELVDIKQKYSENEYELTRRYEELKTKHAELLDNYRHTQNLANALQTQLEFVKCDIENIRKEKQKLCDEKDAELRSLQESLKQSQEKQKELEIKWQHEFESLRTQHADREEQFMVDCEWKMRSMQKTCKEKLDTAKKEKSEALEKANEIAAQATEQLEHVSHLLPLEAEINQLRGLSNEQRESLTSMSDQMADLRNDLEAANLQLEEEIKNVRKIRLHCDNALSDKDRQMIQKIEEARGTVAMEWEQRLLEEMTRLTNELDMVHAEERREALDKLQQEHIEEIKVLTCRYGSNEEELRTEITELRKELQEKCEELHSLKEKTENRLYETRLHLQRADSEFQKSYNREIEKREQLTEQLKSEFAKEKAEMEEQFRERLNQVKDEFAKELVNTTEEMQQKHRIKLEQQWAKLIAEKEDALQTMESRHRIRLEEAANRIKELEIQHQRDFKEMKTNFEIERTTLESRDLQNSQEIEQLHRKCRCLTNLFEEMRMRYERREPRPEDLREIAELRERCESQERDLHSLTERLREIQMEREIENSAGVQPHRKSKASSRKPPPKALPTNCDVIYEENEERESPHKEDNGIIDAVEDGDEEDEDDEEEDDDDEEANNESENEESQVDDKVSKEINDASSIIAVQS